MTFNFVQGTIGIVGRGSASAIILSGVVMGILVRIKNVED